MDKIKATTVNRIKLGNYATSSLDNMFAGRPSINPLRSS